MPGSARLNIALSLICWVKLNLGFHAIGDVTSLRKGSDAEQSLEQMPA